VKKLNRNGWCALWKRRRSQEEVRSESRIGKEGGQAGKTEEEEVESMVAGEFSVVARGSMYLREKLARAVSSS
jgi:hypothetical protein